MDLVILIGKLTGKYAKQTLIELERLELSEETYRQIRKIVLDGYADYKREIDQIRQKVDRLN